MAVRAGDVGGGQELFLGQRVGLVIGAQPALFGDHLGFLADIFGFQEQMAHPVGFEPKAQFQAFFFECLEIGRVVVAGEGIFVATVGSDLAGELTARHVGRAFEHQMFQKVRYAGQSARFVAGADFVPDLGNDHRCPMILADQHFQAIPQSKFVDGDGGKGAWRIQQAKEQQWIESLGHELDLNLGVCVKQTEMVR